jgi:hypothetical protein
MTLSSAGDDSTPPRPVPERIQISPDVLFQEIEGEGVLMDTAKETYFSLDAMGTAIWKLLAANPDLDSARSSLLKNYEVSPEALEKDLAAFIANLIDAGLVVPQP